MIPKVWTLIDKMETDGGACLPDDWYPDIMPLSSETLMEIVKDFGFELPDFFRSLTWKDDFAENVSYITSDVFREIREMYQTNIKAFIVCKDTVTIEVGNDKANVRRIQSWANVMPTEVMKEPLCPPDQGGVWYLTSQNLKKESGSNSERNYLAAPDCNDILYTKGLLQK